MTCSQQEMTLLRKWTDTMLSHIPSSRAVKVAEDRTIDPALLFQRFLVVSQTGDLRLDEVMNYELCPYPMSLFEAKNIAPAG